MLVLLVIPSCSNFLVTWVTYLRTNCRHTENSHVPVFKRPLVRGVFYCVVVTTVSVGTDGLIPSKYFCAVFNDAIKITVINDEFLPKSTNGTIVNNCPTTAEPTTINKVTPTLLKSLLSSVYLGLINLLPLILFSSVCYTFDNRNNLKVSWLSLDKMYIFYLSCSYM